MALDQFTQLRQMGYSGTVPEMLSKYFSDLTGLDTIGEQLLKALDAEMARQVIGVSATAPGIVAVPGGLSATGVPSPTTFLSGDGSWKVPNVSGGGVNDPNAAHPGQNENISGIWNYSTQPTGITKNSVGLGNVDNTADLNKPVSTATGTALNGKAPTVHQHAWADITSGVPNFVVGDGSGNVTVAKATPGSVFRVLIGPGLTYTTQPLRNVLSTRTDIFFQYVMATLPNSSAGYAITGDSWKRR